MPRLRGLLSGRRDVNELRLLTRGGQTRWIRFSTHPVWDDAQGRVVRLLGAVQDVAHKAQSVVQEAVGTVKEEARNQGLTS